MTGWYGKQTELARIANYIEENPVRAGLATAPEQFQWSSASPIINRPQVANCPTTLRKCRNSAADLEVRPTHQRIAASGR
jgi:hypothetical protein